MQIAHIIEYIRFCMLQADWPTKVYIRLTNFGNKLFEIILDMAMFYLVLDLVTILCIG